MSWRLVVCFGVPFVVAVGACAIARTSVATAYVVGVLAACVAEGLYRVTQP